MRQVDTLPPAPTGLFLRYEGFHGIASSCRARCYPGPPETGGPVIVLTDLDHGTSITNRAERAFWLAWVHFGRPWPCRFIEHYMGHTGPATGIKHLDDEHVDEIFFAGTSGDGPIEIRFHEGSLGPPAGPGSFCHPDWRRLDLALLKARLRAQDKPVGE